MSAEDRTGDGAGRGVGPRLRFLRKAHGLSGRALAERAAVTPAYLSRLETGRVSPTVSTLARLMDALGEPLWRIFADGRPEGPVVRADERHLIRHDGFSDALVTPSREGRLEVLETTIDPGSGSGGEYVNWGEEECVLILSGRLSFTLREERYELRPGDSITYSSRVPRSWENPGPEVARVLWIVTPGGSAAL